MYSIIVTTHGKMAQGLQDSLTMIMGEQREIDFIFFMQEDTVGEYEKRLNIVVDKIGKEKEVLILTDLFGGTPNNVATKMAFLNKERVKVISGINFPMIIEAIIRSKENIDEVLSEIITAGIKGIVKVNFDNRSSEDDE